MIRVSKNCLEFCQPHVRNRCFVEIAKRNGFILTEVDKNKVVTVKEAAIMLCELDPQYKDYYICKNIFNEDIPTIEQLYAVQEKIRIILKLISQRKIIPVDLSKEDLFLCEEIPSHDESKVKLSNVEKAIKEAGLLDIKKSVNERDFWQQLATYIRQDLVGNSIKTNPTIPLIIECIGVCLDILIPKGNNAYNCKSKNKGPSADTIYKCIKSVIPTERSGRKTKEENEERIMILDKMKSILLSDKYDKFRKIYDVLKNNLLVDDIYLYPFSCKNEVAIYSLANNAV